MERRSETRRLVMGALFTALVAVGTMVIRVPIPAAEGYFNVGDAMIFVAALLMGPAIGAVAGGLGSALADFLSGYPQWMWWTLGIKGLEGLLVGLLGYAAYQTQRKATPRIILVMVLGAGWMILGYYVASWQMYDLYAAWAHTPMNILQGALSVVLAVGLLRFLKSVRI